MHSEFLTSALIEFFDQFDGSQRRSEGDGGVVTKFDEVVGGC